MPVLLLFLPHHQDAFAIRSTNGRARSNRRKQQEEVQEDEEPVETKEEDDFFGASSAPKQHERRHVDASFSEFNQVSEDEPDKKAEGGSFWDEKEDDFWGSSSAASTKKKVDSRVDKILDDFGSMFQIKVSDNVHENVKSRGGVGA